LPATREKTKPEDWKEDLAAFLCHRFASSICTIFWTAPRKKVTLYSMRPLCSSYVWERMRHTSESVSVICQYANVDSGVSFAALLAHRRGSPSTGNNRSRDLDPVALFVVVPLPFSDVCELFRFKVAPLPNGGDPWDFVVEMRECEGEEEGDSS